MNLFSWLFSRSPAMTDAAPDWPPAIEREDPRVEQASRHDPEPQSDPLQYAELEANGRLDLEPVYTMIDYRDAQGIETRRRITMRHIRLAPTGAQLVAVCHERRALRTFRCDRIVDFIEPDGEVIAPKQFLRDICMVDLDRLATPEVATAPATRKRPGRPRGTDAESVARLAKSVLKSRIELLVLAGRADDTLHAAEVEEIQRFIEDEIARLAADGRLHGPATIEVVDPICRSVPRLRPLRENLRSLVTELASLDADETARFTRALSAVIRADGVVALSEELFLADLNAAALTLTDIQE